MTTRETETNRDATTRPRDDRAHRARGRTTRETPGQPMEPPSTHHDRAQSPPARSPRQHDRAVTARRAVRAVAVPSRFSPPDLPKCDRAHHDRAQSPPARSFPQVSSGFPSEHLTPSLERGSPVGTGATSQEMQESAR